MSGYRNLSNTFLQQRKRQITAESEGSVQRCLREFKQKVKGRPDRHLLVSEWHLWKGVLTKKQRAHYFYSDGRRRPVDADGFPLPVEKDEVSARRARPVSAKVVRKAKHNAHLALVAQRASGRHSQKKKVIDE